MSNLPIRYEREDKSFRGIPTINTPIEVMECNDCRLRWVIPFACCEPLTCPLCQSKRRFKERLTEAEATVRALRLWKCEHGNCECVVPEGLSVEFYTARMTPQKEGWYACREGDSRHEDCIGPKGTRHAAIAAALDRSAEAER